ncbi:hypothetical protein C8R42DRAFT_537276, partial [Lentinula raphanica]
QRERHKDVPPAILSDPLYRLTWAFRAHMQHTGEPFTKRSRVVVDARTMEIFEKLAGEL